MGKKKKAPEYTSATYNTGGLFGSSTADKNGVTYTPTSQITNTGNIAWSGLQNTLQGLSSNDYANDPNFQAYQNKLNSTMAQNYDTSVLSQLANRGLMKSSGLQSATNAFADTLANQTTDLYDSYYNRLSNNLSNYQNVLSNLYNYITGVNTGAQNQANNVSNYNLNRTSVNNGSNSNIGSMLGGVGSLVGNGAKLYSTLKGGGGSGTLLSGGSSTISNIS